MPPIPLRARVAVLALAAVTLAAAAATAQLTPPPGPVAPSMKRLDQIEPRRCLSSIPSSADAVRLITEPGQYYLDADLAGEPGKHGILVAAAGPVSIDLNGFSLRGAQGALDAVHASGAGVNLHITVTGWGGGGGGGSGGVIRGWRGGIAITDAHRVHLSNLTIENCAAVGVAALRCENIVHRDIAARSCAAGAAHLTAPTEPTASPFHIEVDGASGGYLSSFGILIEHPEGPGEVSITRSSISGAAGHGIHVRAVPTGSGPRGGSLILHSQTSSTRNALHGFFIELAAGSEPALRCTGLTATGNTGDGIHIGVAGGDGAQHAGSAAVIDSCDFSSNGGCGISSANPIYTQSTTCGSNALHGARVSITDQYELALDAHGCVFKKNAASGLHGPRGRYANADCRFSDNGIAGVSVDAGCLLLTRCDLTHNGETGADVRNASLTVDSSVFRRNGGFGARIQAGTAIATGMVCELNGGGGGGGSGGALFLDCPAVTLTRCIFNDNLGDGVVCSATTGPVRWMAPECVASRNAGSGFDLGGCDGGEVTRCSAIGNGAFGMVFRPTFARGRIEGNTATANAGGIAVEGQLNLVASNTVTTGPLGGLLITQGNHAAPTIGPAGLATDTNPRSNILLP